MKQAHNDFLRQAYAQPETTYRAYIATLRDPEAENKATIMLTLMPDVLIDRVENDHLIPEPLRKAIGFALRWKAQQLQKAITAHLN